MLQPKRSASFAIALLTLLLLSASAVRGAEPAKDFLRYIYGAEDFDIANICLASDDLWMLHGPTNAAALAEIKSLKLNPKPTSVTSGLLLHHDLYLVEMRDGKVDPAFNLEGVYLLQRQLISRFLFAAITRNDAMLRRFTTDPDKLKIVGPKAKPGDMDVYSDVIGAIPIVRSSKPADDAKSKSVTYRLPLGNQGLSLTLVMVKGQPKIDTSKTLQLPLGFFFRESPDDLEP